MATYTKAESRTWAREKLVGAVNCTIPSFTADLKGLNEKGIRHDIALAKEHGFIGSLAIGEVSITPEEYIDFIRIAKDEGGEDFFICHHACFNTLEENIEMAQLAEAAGADLILLSYPPSFYPESEDEVLEFTRTFADSTNLAIILFPMTIWNFSRLHPSDISTGLIRRILDDAPNVAVIKAEGGYPNIMNAVECHRLFGDEVVISVPIEADLIPLSQVIPIQLSATSDHEYYGPVIPQIMKLIRAGDNDRATELFWKLHPARVAKNGLFAAVHGGSVLNRMGWKFQGWLQGYNGGPLRMPTMRLQDKQMRAYRNALLEAGFDIPNEPLKDFFIGRNPA
ncbi:dihydrodipicolinate synthase family protein [Nocardioides sp. NBC_00368]|uniref:dihydrodipicolinate synthase family protein n=1 Tax=Nocardioides sp. NBC_00368 TaxID=2976000 RepID=UPI002E2156A7